MQSVLAAIASDAAEATAVTGFGASLLRMTLALLAVCALAVFVLRLLRRRSPAGRSSLRVIDRLSLEPRRTLYVVEAAGRYLLVGVGDGPMTVLAELDAAKLAQPEPAPIVEDRFTAVLRRAVGGKLS